MDRWANTHTLVRARTHTHTHIPPSPLLSPTPAGRRRGPGVQPRVSGGEVWARDRALRGADGDAAGGRVRKVQLAGGGRGGGGRPMWVAVFDCACACCVCACVRVRTRLCLCACMCVCA